jgi:PAP2 superfamily.
MKKLLLTIMAINLAVMNVWTQERHPDGYLTDETRPDGLLWLPAPPALTGADFTYDFYYYQWGRIQRDGASGDLALLDESEPLENIFGPLIGLTLDEVTTPEIFLLVERAVSDAHAANKKVKDYYQRTRPFAQFKEPSLKPWDDDEEAETFSYPSGHSSRGWMYAFVLASVVPDLAESLFSRAYLYAMNRVVCGHHWKSDTDASLMLTAGIFATIVGTDAYQEQLKKARAEYQILKGNTRIDAPKESYASKGAAIYDMEGRLLNAKPGNGVYIQDGQKFISK